MNATTEPRRIVLRCQCGHCELPFAYVQNGVLLIQSRHSGETHINAVRIEDVEPFSVVQNKKECAIVEPVNT
jgi:hypothetical protein